MADHHPVLITQCLQNDFLEPLAAHQATSNRLHVGRVEAQRLLGPEAERGPVMQVLGWARQQPLDALDLVHIRDWHDPSDARQQAHLDMFGPHCLAGTRGAELVQGLGDEVADRPNERFVDALTLNDFVDTSLEAELTAIRNRVGKPLRIGVIGVWTEAKVTFLLYELATRLGVRSLATCSALTASASRSQHFIALDQLRRILGVRVHDSLGEFTEWLQPGGNHETVRPARAGVGPKVAVDGELAADDAVLVDYLYRDAQRVALEPLAGGFSGAAVYRARSYDAYGQEQAPTVLKLGPRDLIAAERVAFERVEAVLGNDAPSLRGFRDLAERAGLKFAFASMGQGRVATLQQLYTSGSLSDDAFADLLDRIFDDVLGRFTRAAVVEPLSFAEAFTFHPRYADGIRAKVAEILPGAGATLSFPGDYLVPNPADFYDGVLAELMARSDGEHLVSWVHGDLNGANVLVDGRGNTWIIDFLHTTRKPVFTDLVKLENDLLYIMTPLADEADLAQALVITRGLRRVQDLAAPLPETLEGLTSPVLQRCWRSLGSLRSHVAQACGADRDPLSYGWGRLRYAVRTLFFEESSTLQKRWALAAAGGLVEDLTRAHRTSQVLRVDWLDADALGTPGGLGLTLCPGRADRGRVLEADLDALRDAGVSRLLTLLTDPEVERLQVGGLSDGCAARGLGWRQHPIRDQGVPGLDDMQDLVAWTLAALQAGEPVLVHCMGGLGRSGTLAACVLVAQGHDPDAAIQHVRDARGPRAVEVASQEALVRRFADAQVRVERDTDRTGPG